MALLWQNPGTRGGAFLGHNPQQSGEWAQDNRTVTQQLAGANEVLPALTTLLPGIWEVLPGPRS